MHFTSIVNHLYVEFYLYVHQVLIFAIFFHHTTNNVRRVSHMFRQERPCNVDPMFKMRAMVSFKMFENFRSQLGDFVSFHCSTCTRKYGPSKYKRKSKRSRISIDYVALNEGDSFALDKASHFHLPRFLQFTGEKNISIQEDLTIPAKPILISNANCDVVGMKLPGPRKEITIDYITDCCGSDRPVEVMDVISQQRVTPGGSYTNGVNISKLMKNIVIDYAM